MSTCLRTHQLKRNGSYWDTARTFCGIEKKRKLTTTTNEKVNCKECLRFIVMALESESKILQEKMESL